MEVDTMPNDTFTYPLEAVFTKIYGKIDNSTNDVNQKFKYPKTNSDTKI